MPECIHGRGRCSDCHSTFVPPPRRTQLLWAAIDFDGTLAESEYSPDNPTFKPGLPVKWAQTKVAEVARAGYKIIVYTARPWADYELVEAWLNHYNVPWSRIVCGKLLAHIYIDDRAINADADSWVPQR